MKILILGATGMLGSMVFDYLKSSGLDVIGTSRKRSGGFHYFDVYEGFNDVELDLEDIDYVINCIGITKPYCHDDNMAEIKNAIFINSLFPHTLSELAKKNDFRVVQIATDCVYSGSKGKYTEDVPHDPIDVYGKTKSLGEVRSPDFLNIRCSIVGPERFNKAFLLEWFLSQPKDSSVNGFTNHLWNGITTLQFAKLCREIIRNEKFDALTIASGTYHFVPNNVVSKYELLCTFNEVFDRGVKVTKKEDGEKVVDRTLRTKYDYFANLYPRSTIKEAIEEIKNYIEETDFYNA